MLTSLVASRLIRWPNPTTVETKAGWLVTSEGQAEGVLPLGVSRSSRFGNRPLELDISMYAIHELLRDAVVLPDDEAAGRLAELCRMYPVPLLCHHGLGQYHRPDGAACMTRKHGGSAAVSVTDVVNMVTGLDGVRSLALNLSTQRKPASRRMVMNALVWPVIAEDTRARFEAEIERDGRLPTSRVRQIVTSTLDAGFRHTALRLGFDWTPQQRPQMVLHASTNLAAYMADFARHITAATGDAVDRSVVCIWCTTPFTPRRQPQPGAAFCSQPECQKERKRRNQAASRARRKGQDG